MAASKNASAPPWLADLPRRPNVYATLGTVLGRAGGGYHTYGLIIEALRDEPINVILTVGPNIDPDELGPRPTNVRIERFIPQEWLLPRCDLVLTHGGFGTVKGALSHGVPLVLLPHSADQPDNAARCAALGTGIVVRGPRSADAIRDAVRLVLAEEDYRHVAQRLCDEILELPGPEDVVPMLEQLVSRRRQRSCGVDG